MTVRRADVPQRSAAIESAAECDYRCAFRVPRAATDERTAEQWARAVFETAPSPVRVFLTTGWRLVLGLRLGPRSAPDHVLGWRVASATPKLVVLQQESRLIVAHNVVQVDGASVYWSTFVRYRRPLGRWVWTLVVPFHLLTVPRLLGRACRAAG